MTKNSDEDYVSKLKKCSELVFSDQIISECEKLCSGGEMSHLTLMQYQTMSSEERSRIQNRVRQWSLKARQSLPSDHGVFCLVLGHLL